MLREITDNLTNLINQNVSINLISRRTGLGKSTIYYHYKKIKGKKYKEPVYKIELSEKEGEVVGIFSGDGSQYYEPRWGSYEINIHFGMKNRPYALYVQNLFETYFNKHFWLIGDGNGNLRLRTKSIKIFNYFSHYIKYDKKIKHSTVHLKNLNFPRHFKIGFIRGLVDTDGSVRIYRGKLNVNYYTTSISLCFQFGKILKEFGFKYAHGMENRSHLGYKTLHRITIRSKSIDSFLNTVKPFKFLMLGR